MTQACFDYSLKNIPAPNSDTYLRGLIVKCEHFLQRLRWKVIHFMNDRDGSNQEVERNTYGFKTPKNAPQHSALTHFENDLSHLLSNLEYKESNNSFQKKLKKDVHYINRSRKLFIEADKTSNIYEVEPENYRKLMRDNVTATYTKADDEVERRINIEARELTEQLQISDRVEKITHKNAYITLKDHKPDFDTRTKCRLINPTKSNIGKISKQMIEKINQEIIQKTNLRQLKNTDSAIKWFEGTKSKTRLQFIQIDIVDYYPSVSRELFDRAVQFARNFVDIDERTVKIILNARKTILHHNDGIWSKNSNSDFDIAMGAYDGAEVTDLIGLYILHNLKEKVPEIDFGLYRDDGLGMHRRIPKTKLNSIVNRIREMFKDMGLEITCDTNKTVVNFLDVTFDLHAETYEPYRKPNDEPLYINTESNHPRPVIRNIPKAVNKRLATISSSDEKFNKHKENYQKALTNSGYRHTLTYSKETGEGTEKRGKKNRKRKVIYFNPPYNKNLKTNIGKEFLKLIDKNFPKDNKLSKIINRKTVKISYSCTSNMRAIITAHNKKILNEQKQENDPPCNCQSSCVLPGGCRTKCVVYKATATHENKRVEYVGSTANEFKVRYRNHKSSFINENKKNETALSQYIWANDLNKNEDNEKIHPTVSWEILKKCSVYRGGQDTCSLCTGEKLEILKNKVNPSNINHRSDLGGRCAHRNRHMLSGVT